jgi:hypothetical protein
MRIHIVLFSMLVYAAGSMQPLHAQEPKTADEVVARMLARDGIRESTSGGYTGGREYVLENRLFQIRAQMLVRVDCDRNGMEHFEVLSQDGSKSANERVLREILATESDSSHPDKRPKSGISPDNYTFRMIGSSSLDGRTSYVIEVIPKRQDLLLFRGRIWVDAEDYALARVEGELAKSPSFWTRKVNSVQQYQKRGPFWFPVSTTSVTDARMFGATDVNIRYFDYKPVLAAPTGHSSSSFMEAHNDQR